MSRVIVVGQCDGKESQFLNDHCSSIKISLKIINLHKIYKKKESEWPKQEASSTSIRESMLANSQTLCYFC